MDGDDIGVGPWSRYDNAFTRWLGRGQLDRDPELYGDAAFAETIEGALADLPDIELTAAEADIVTRLLAGDGVELADEGLLAQLQEIADAVPAGQVEAAQAAAAQAADGYAAQLAEGANPVVWVVSNGVEAVYNLAFAVTHPGMWLDWSDPQALMRFIYYGASLELFFVLLVAFAILTVCGLIWNRVMWGTVRGIEAVLNAVGRVAAWAGLIMVLQQIVIIFMQRVFAVSDLSFGFGKVVSFPISWWSEELKLYNAAVVALCIGYTFVQGGHVRVDLVYSAVGYRAKRVIDMIGSVVFMLPAAMLLWLYSWFFLWRVLVVPNPSASDTLERLLSKARALRWNVETIGFSPNGFNAYFLFKVLLVFFVATIFLNAVAFLYRSYLEWKEGPEGEGRYLDRDPSDPAIATDVATTS